MSIERPNKRILLVNEQYLRERFDVSDSISSKIIVSSINEAQEFYLSAVIGDKFLNEIYNEVENDTYNNDVLYLLSNFIQPFIGVQSVAILTSKVNYKIGNRGVVKYEDTVAEKKVEDYYKNLVGVALHRMVDFISRHYNLYAEWLSGVQGIKPHLSASTETSIYLGNDVKTKYPVDKGWRR